MTSTRRHGVLSAETGAKGEAAVVKALRANGFGQAERRRVRRHDALDIVICPGLIASVKAGEKAKSASYERVLIWLAEAAAKGHDESCTALLIVQRRGIGLNRAEMWRTWIATHDPLMSGWETTLTNACSHLRITGWGDPT